jgi:hypothetical protein
MAICAYLLQTLARFQLLPSRNCVACVVNAAVHHGQQLLLNLTQMSINGTMPCIIGTKNTMYEFCTRLGQPAVPYHATTSSTRHIMHSKLLICHPQFKHNMLDQV